MLVDYDYTALFNLTPPRHSYPKKVIAAVKGSVNIEEVENLVHAATIRRAEGDAEIDIHMSPDGSCFEFVCGFSDGSFTDGTGGLPILRRHRHYIERALDGLRSSQIREQFHPHAQIRSSTEFGRVDLSEAGGTLDERMSIDSTRREMEAYLSRHAVMGDRIFLRVPEPCLVLLKSNEAQRVRIVICSSVKEGLMDARRYPPVACFALHELSEARNYAASLVGGKRTNVRFAGDRVVFAKPDVFTFDRPARSLELAALRMRMEYLWKLEAFNGAEEALTKLPLSEIAAFKGLAKALSGKHVGIDALDDAVSACIRYEEESGDRVFTQNVGDMLEVWGDRQVDVGLPVALGLSRGSGV